MKNSELIQQLMKLPLNAEVGTYKNGNKNIGKIMGVYLGGEQYRDVSTGEVISKGPDVVIIDYK